MAEADDRPENAEHRGLLWRLLDRFGLLSHPAVIDDEEGDRESDRAWKAMQDWWAEKFNLQEDRLQRYRIWKEMDTFDLVQSVLELYAEESTQRDYSKGRSVWIESSDRKVVEAGEAALANCQIEDRISAIARDVCRMGDRFQRLIYQAGVGVQGWKHAPQEKVHRRDDKYDRLIGFMEDGKTFRGEAKHNVSWPWDYIHFRLLGRDDYSQYGTSLLYAPFRAWRQLVLAEDSVLMYRMRRAPDRNMIFVDIGDMDEVDAVEHVNRWAKRFRKYEFIDPASPAYKKQYNPLTPTEDIFFPTRGDNDRSRVEQLSGAGNMDQLFDLDYFRNKFFGSVRVPKAYFGFEGEINAKATLMQQDVRFARGVKRVQRVLVYGIRGMLDIHYALLPDFGEKGPQYETQMPPISYLDEWERLELVQLRYTIIDSMSQMANTLQLDPRVWATYILLEYAKLPEELVLKLIAKTPTEPAAVVAAGAAGGPPVVPAPPPTGAEEVPSGSDRNALPGESYLRRRVRMLTEERARLSAEAVHRWRMNLTGGDFGAYSLSDAERIAMAKLIHGSPKLRQLIGDIAESHVEDRIAQQVDLSLRPPCVVLNGKVQVLTDTYEDDSEARRLHEDMARLRGKSA